MTGYRSLSTIQENLRLARRELPGTLDRTTILTSKETAGLKSERFRILGVFLLALAVRAVALWMVSDIEIHFPKYPLLAERLKDNGFLTPTVFAYCPLYVYFLAFLQVLTRGASLPILAVQIVYGAAAAALAYAVVRRMADGRAALAAGLLVALSHSMVLHEVNFLADSLGVFLQLLLILALLGAFERPSSGRWAVSGLLLGLLVTLRPIFALAWIGLAPAVWFLFREVRGTHRARWIGILAGVPLLVTLPVTIQNFLAARDLVPVVSPGGYVFYASNNYASPGVRYAPPPLLPMIANAQTHEDEDSVLFFDDAMSVRIATSIIPGLEKPSAVSRFYIRRALDPMKRYPGHFVGLFFQKMFGIVSAYEVHDTIEANAKEGALRRFPLLPYGLIFSIGAVGVFVTRGRWRALLPLYILAGAQVVSLFIFYVTPRLRLPLESILVLFAALAVGWCLESPRRRVLPLFLGVAVLSIVSFVPRTEVMRLIERDQKIQTALAESTLYGSRGDARRALPPLLRLIDLLDNPTSAFYRDANRQLAAVYKRLGDPEGERRAAERARELPRREGIRLLSEKLEAEGENLRNLGLLAEKYIEAGNWVDARKLYGRALELAPEDPTVRLRLAETHLSGGMFEEAASNLELALRDGLDFSRYGLAAHYHLWRFYSERDTEEAELHKEAFRRFLWIFDYVEPSSAEIRGMKEMELR